jgi:hypothetical protein
LFQDSYQQREYTLSSWIVLPLASACIPEWGVLVAVTGNTDVIERRPVDVVKDDLRAQHRGNQPYHRAEELGLPDAEKYLAEYTAESERLAR